MSNGGSQSLALDVPSIDRLTAIWERVLNRSPILPDDNFFDIGGNDFLAIAMFREIEKEMGRRPPVITIYNAPTVATLAAVLHHDSIAPFSPLVLLKPGIASPPIFITHGLGGDVMEVADLAKHMRTDHPIYGIQARGLDEIETPYDRIEDMARYYINVIREIQPKGPYVLIGWSYGGLVQLEMAQRLSESGEEIALLAFLDTWPHPRLWPFRSWLGVLARRAKHHAAAIMRLGFSDKVRYLIHISRGLLNHIGARHGAFRRQRPMGESIIVPPGAVPPGLQRVRDSGLAAWARYQPHYYRGKITFLRASVLEVFPANPNLYWSKLAQELEVHTLPATHLELVRVHADAVAVQLVRCIEKELSRKQNERHPMGGSRPT